MTKTILVTGGAGFVGSNLTIALLEKNFRVVVLDNFFNGKREFLPDHTNLTIVEGDIRNSQLVRNTIMTNSVDSIYHLAALHFIPYCNAHPQETIQVNVEGTESILQASIETSVQKIVYASTAAIYGIYDDFNLENHQPDPMDIYGNTKLFGEYLLRTTCSQFGIQGAIARLFNIYGPNETNSHIIPEILDQLKAGNYTINLGNLQPRRDYIYVADVVSALMQLEEKSTKKIEAYNVGTGEEYSVENLVDIVSEIVNRKIQVEIEPARVRKQERMHLLAGIGSIRSRTGWNPEYKIMSGLRKLIEIEYPELLGK